MDPIVAFLQGAVLPGTAVFVLVLALAWRGLDARAAAAGGALGAAAGYLAGYLALFGMPDFPAVRSVEWMPPVAVAGLLLGLTVLVRGQGPALTALAGVPLLGALGWMWYMIARGVLRTTDFPWPATGVLAFGALVVLLFLALPAVRLVVPDREKTPRWPVTPFLLMVLATAVSLSLLASGSARVSQMTGIVAAGSGALGVAGLIAWTNPALPRAEGVLSVLLGFHLLLATWYSELGWPAVTAFLAAQAGLTVFAMGEQSLSAPRSRSLRIGGAAAAVVLSIGTTVLLIVIRGLPDI